MADNVAGLSTVFICTCLNSDDTMTSLSCQCKYTMQLTLKWSHRIIAIEIDSTKVEESASPTESCRMHYHRQSVSRHWSYWHLHSGRGHHCTLNLINMAAPVPTRSTDDGNVLPCPSNGRLLDWWGMCFTQSISVSYCIISDILFSIASYPSFPWSATSCHH